MYMESMTKRESKNRFELQEKSEIKMKKGFKEWSEKNCHNWKKQH